MVKREKDLIKNASVNNENLRISQDNDHSAGDGSHENSDADESE